MVILTSVIYQLSVIILARNEIIDSFPINIHVIWDILVIFLLYEFAGENFQWLFFFFFLYIEKGEYSILAFLLFGICICINGSKWST